VPRSDAPASERRNGRNAHVVGAEIELIDGNLFVACVGVGVGGGGG